MKILLTGATGYIGQRLLLILVNKGYKIVCCVRDINGFNPPKSLLKSVQTIEVNFLNKHLWKSVCSV
ncbi:MAG: NAD-dependent epimerase/dehydratase family protein [Cyclobacteriaceae bacterium]|nr:NAD-dependent epimerase/dehydratase family protein [Cyclobacteriaceae bacterium]MCK5469866.1 NAD-dependent epimerase/dehydratase family protein [Cyclobacteriaceae bacterium]